MTHDRTTLLSVLLTVADVTISLVASSHVILTKRDTKAAIGWIGLIWLSPFFGTFVYLVFGINRINRRARALRRGRKRLHPRPQATACGPDDAGRLLHPRATHLRALAELVGRASRAPLTAGNAIEPFDGGDDAYPRMLRAIDEATRTVGLATYIFNHDRVGLRFVEALERAERRGVQVRVLIDDIGARYTFPPVAGALRRGGVRTATFVPSSLPGWLRFVNLRCHRKILVVDGQVGFTGGLNIDEHFTREFHGDQVRRDLHFRLTGPIVASLAHVFADDWLFCTHEALHGEAWSPHLPPVGDMLARGIADGPEDDQDPLADTLLGALACARDSVVIITPYFLPDAALISALIIAALRGIAIEILLPRQNNIGLVQWASTDLIDQVLEAGCRVWATRPPFDHTKLMVVDGAWTFFGSANWDPRSLRLNFEYNVECYGTHLADAVSAIVRDRFQGAELVTRDQIAARALPVRLRDGIARLMSPYL